METINNHEIRLFLGGLELRQMGETAPYRSISFVSISISTNSMLVQQHRLPYRITPAITTITTTVHIQHRQRQQHRHLLRHLLLLLQMVNITRHRIKRKIKIQWPMYNEQSKLGNQEEKQKRDFWFLISTTNINIVRLAREAAAQLPQAVGSRYELISSIVYYQLLRFARQYCIQTCARSFENRRHCAW